MRHRPAVLVALLAAMMVTPACAKATPVGMGSLGTAREAAWGQASSAAGQAALSELLGGARELSRTEAGMDPIAFTSFDKDSNGKLSLAEQASVFKTVWSAVQEATEAKESQADEAEETDTTTYKVPHTLQLSPTQAELFIDAGEILPAVYQTVASAKKTIYFDLFLLGGAEGLKLAEVLAAKAKEGVDVRVIHDPGLGLGGTTQTQVLKAVSYLQAQGVAVKMFPLRYLKKRKGHPLANRFQIDHNKFLVVDGETAMIGTMNLIDIGTMNHDVFLRLTGDAARELQAIHEATWALKGPKTPDLRRVEQPKQPEPVKTKSVLQAAGLDTVATSMARVVKTDIDQQTTKKILIENIKNAKKSVHVAIFEFGDLDVAKALIDAYKRGVDVRVLSDKNAQYAKYVAAFKHLKIYGTPNLLTMNRLREAGVPVKWFVPQTDDQELHMKVAMFDGERAIVGSTNFTYQAFNTFRETSVEVVGGPVPARLEAMFEKDWATRGAPVTPPTFFEKSIMTAVKYMDKFNLSWW